MKTERRHELQTNTLALELARWIDRVKPYTKLIAGFFVAVLVIGVASLVMSRRNQMSEIGAWDDYFAATNAAPPDLDALEAIADDNLVTSVEPWAKLALADRQLFAGTRLLFYDKASALQTLQRAADNYEGLKRSASQVPVTQRATFGLARTYEVMGRLDKARGEYLQVEGAFAAIAKQRAETLEQKDMQQFYDWFASAELPGRATSGPLSTPIQQPESPPDGALELDDFSPAPSATSPPSDDAADLPASEPDPPAAVEPPQ
jgi:hypothetical protein